MSSFSSFIGRLNIIKQIPIFSKLNWFQQQKIARCCVVEEYKKGDLIRKEGDPADYFYSIISGRVQAYNLNTMGIKNNVETIHRGMHFGVISVFTGEAHSMTVEALNDSVILKIAQEDFHSILKAIPTLAIELGQSLSRRVRTHRRGGKPGFEGHIIAVYSPVKGTGSSSYALNLALSLEKETKKKVVFVNIQTTQHDSSPASVESLPSIQWQKNALGLKDVIDDQEKIASNIIKNEIPVDVLNIVFDAQDDSLRRQISPLVSTLASDYHYVLVDLPNEMGDFVYETLVQSDVVHLVTVERTKDLESIRKVIDYLEDTYRERLQKDKIRVVIRPLEERLSASFEEINKLINYHVYTVLPQFQSAHLLPPIGGNSLIFQPCDEKSEYSKTLTRMARQIGGVMVGLVLGGGAALGVAHVGVIRVLEEENIPVDVVVGSSMGALIGSMWCVGRNADQLEIIAREFEKKENMAKLFSFCNPFKALIGGGSIHNWLKDHLGEATFYDAKIPLKVVAYDLIHREELVIEDGLIADAVRKSIAIPGVIMPVKENDRIIIDGGVLNPLPTNVLAHRGIRRIIAINVLQSPAHTSEGFDMLQQKLREKGLIPFSKAPFHYVMFRLGKFVSRFFVPNIADIIVRTLQASEYVIAVQSAQHANVVIHPNLVGINWFELYRVDDLIKRGEEATRHALPQIRKLIES